MAEGCLITTESFGYAIDILMASTCQRPISLLQPTERLAREKKNRPRGSVSMGYSIGMTTLQLNNSARWGFLFTEKCYLTEQ
jgi:hypothetical protein